MSQLLRLGTRRSLLAWAQSSWVASEIERLNPGLKVELVGIDTRGDKIQDVPLQAVQGKEFFVAELDDALRSGRVDLTVHSMKDLSLDRPAGFTLACVPPRENPRDVVLFGPRAIERLRAGARPRIGTSSPRRLENIPSFLERALPDLGPARGRPRACDFMEIRGNVNTRLSRVHEAVGSERYLDGVVLAFAGLIRLWADAKGREELAKLLAGVRWMVLPLRDCPAAAAQGALAVECRVDDARTREALAKLDDPSTRRRVGVERGLLAEWGGGCHQRFGATAVDHPELGLLFHVRGAKPDGEFVEELRWKSDEPRPRSPRAWDGSRARASEAVERSTSAGAPADGAVFVAHSRALRPEWPDGALDGARVWTSGTPSWFRLAERGVWVEGCAEGLGFAALAEQLSEPVLQLPEQSRWNILTHEAAAEEWRRAGHGGSVVPTYRLESAELPASVEQAVGEATHLFWSSASQHDRLGGLAARDAHHACGPGATARRLREKGLRPAVFPSAEEWRAWLGIANTD